MSQLPSHLKYAKTHEWALLEQDNQVRVGITDHAQEQLGDLVYIELPELGRRVQAGEACAVVESVKAASDIYSPASGEIIDINTALSESPEAVNQGPYEAWLFRVKASSPAELDRLLDAEGYRSLAEADE